ncbi:MAG: hypothetical protein FWE33_02905 [Defluviitaleaceae bacterium]|nr:hypothetical protein [Defluviitaleaceae bacterium]
MLACANFGRIILVACNYNAGNENRALAGTIVIEGNLLTITTSEVFTNFDKMDELALRAVQVVNYENIEQLSEFGLTQSDMPSGIAIRF